ncbi:MAG: hypothetical protein KGS72_27870 [Cyanobacteria bacterium REEB67]|nr:hypothetical protein [Cyanobacteria bacterium REEB67]
MQQTKKLNPLVLQVALIALLVTMTPAGAQTDSTTTSTTTTTTQSTPDTGLVDGVPVRKDAWNWYWNEKAHLDTNNSSGFWGDDAISNFFKNISNSVVVPFWNAAMEYDFVRAGLLLILAGMLLGVGASIVMPKKPESK